MAIKELKDVMAADDFTMPKYLIVKNEELNYFYTPAGQGLYVVADGQINAMVKNEDGTEYVDSEEPVVTIAGDEILYIDKLHKDPVAGVAQPGRIKFVEGDDEEKALLDVFKRFVDGFYSVHSMILATDVLADVEEPETSTTTTQAPETTTTTTAPETSTTTTEAPENLG